MNEQGKDRIWAAVFISMAATLVVAGNFMLISQRLEAYGYPAFLYGALAGVLAAQPNWLRKVAIAMCAPLIFASMLMPIFVSSAGATAVAGTMIGCYIGLGAGNAAGGAWWVAFRGSKVYRARFEEKKATPSSSQA